MARYNEILVGRFNRGVQKLFSMKGEAPAPQLSSDIQVVHSLYTASDRLYLEGWNSFAAESPQAAVAAQFGFIQLRNPAKSGIIVHVIKAFVVPRGIADRLSLYVISPSIAQGATVSPLARLDNRYAASPSALATVGTSASPNTNGALMWVTNVLAGSDKVVDAIVTNEQALPLLPGDAYLLV